MKNFNKIIQLITFIYLGCIFNINAQNTNNANDYVSDRAMIDNFTKGAVELYNSGDFISQQTITEQLSKASLNSKKINISNTNNASSEYSDIKKSVLVLGLIFNRGGSPKNHATLASAFVVDETGICVTNYHIFKIMGQAREGAKILTTMDFDGNIFPIKELLVASEKDDLVIFRIDKGDKKLNPIKLSNKPSKVGENISLISHPKNNLYQYSGGYVTRYYYHQINEAPRMATSVQFAQGSSGAPLFNKLGEVVGVVSSSIPLYVSGTNKQQMVIYETIPVSSIKSLIE